MGNEPLTHQDAAELGSRVLAEALLGASGELTFLDRRAAELGQVVMRGESPDPQQYPSLLLLELSPEISKWLGELDPLSGEDHHEGVGCPSFIGATPGRYSLAPKEEEERDGSYD